MADATGHAHLVGRLVADGVTRVRAEELVTNYEVRRAAMTPEERARTRGIFGYAKVGAAAARGKNQC